MRRRGEKKRGRQGGRQSRRGREAVSEGEIREEEREGGRGS